MSGHIVQYEYQSFSNFARIKRDFIIDRISVLFLGHILKQMRKNDEIFLKYFTGKKSQVHTLNIPW